MKTTTVSKRFIALLCCVVVCIALIATALGVNLASRAQAEDVQEGGIELLEEEPSGDIQLIEEETEAVPEDSLGGEAYQAGEPAVTEDAVTPEEPDSGEPDDTPVPGDSAEPEDFTEPEGIPEESGESEETEAVGSEEPVEPEEAEPSGSDESVEADLNESEEELDAEESESEDADADAEDAGDEDADAEEDAASDEDDYGIMLLEVIANGDCGADVHWELDENGTLYIYGTGAMDDWSSTSAPWYSNRTSIKSVIIEDGVTSIGNWAFHNCTALTDISISDDVTSIGSYAFESCASLESVELPSMLTSIDNYAFANCTSLAGISIPDSVTSIGEAAFEYCSSLESVKLPSMLTSISDFAFESCSALTGISIPEGVTSIGDHAFQYCESLANIELPPTLTSIGFSAFFNCTALTSISIPDGVTSIGRITFYGCSALTDISIPEGVTSIGESAFENCTRLVSVELPSTLTNIGEYAFRFCPLNGDSMWDTTTVNAGAAIYSIDSDHPDTATETTYYEGYTLRIPESVTSIGQYAFQYSSINIFVIGSNLTSITGNAFTSSSFDAIIFDNFQDQVTIDDPKNISSEGSLVYLRGESPIEVSVSKEWKDADNQDGIRPVSIDVQLLADGDPIGTQTLSEDNGWSCTWENLDVYSEGQEIVYSVQEINVPDGYKASYGELTDNGDGTYSIVITNTETIDFTVSKDWNDNDDQDGIRPEEIVVVLLADGDPTDDTLTLNESNGWSGSFTGLPMFRDQGTEIDYSIAEVTVDGYISEIFTRVGGHFMINNTHTPETIDISGSKVWDDADDQDGIRPDEITINLLADGVAAVDSDGNAITTTATAADNYAWSFTELPKYRDHGTEIVYSVSEDAIDGYEASYGDLTDNGDGTYSLVVTNTHTPEQFDATVIKEWDDADDQDGIRPDSITVHLWADNTYEVASATITPDEDGIWSYTFEGLPKYRDGGVEIVYSVTEDDVWGYVNNPLWLLSSDSAPSFELMAADSSTDKSVTITNTHIPEAETPAPVMSDDVGAGTEVNPGESLTYTIRYTNGSEDGATITITDVLDEGLDFVSATDGGTYDEATRTITWIISDVAANYEGSVSFTVVVNESALVAGEVSNSATVQINDEPAVTTNIVTNPVKALSTVTFEVVKVWDDNNDLYGARPDLIVVVLLENGQATTLTQLLSAENSWTGTFSDLPEYDADGNKIAYSIAEVTVPNYTSVITGDQDSGFTVTNTYDFDEIANPEPGTPDSGNPNSGNPNTGTPDSSNPEPGVPQTGQDSLPIAPLAVAGAAIVAAGVALLVVRRRRAA